MCCGGSCLVKLWLWAINLVTMTIGCTLIYLGYHILDLDSSKDFGEIVSLNIQSTSWMILALGIVVLVVSFFGFFGACCQFPILLKTYAVLMLMTIVCECALLFFAKQNTMDIDEKVEQAMRAAIQEFQTKTHTAYLLEKFQYHLDCCGWKNNTDYPLLRIPGSCCGIDPGSEQDYKPEYCIIREVPDSILYGGCKKKLNVDELVSSFGTTFYCSTLHDDGPVLFGADGVLFGSGESPLNLIKLKLTTFKICIYTNNCV